MKTKKRCRRSAVILSCILAGCMLTPAAAFAEDEPSDYAYGDVNLSGDVDVSDAVLLARFAAEDKEATITEEGKKMADVNRDGNLTSEDTVQILEFIAKKRSVLGVAAQQTPAGKAVNLTEKLPAAAVNGKVADEAFLSGQLRFTADLLRETDLYTRAELKEGEAPKNLLISPLSVSLALGMTANGAKGETQQQMEQVLSKTLGISDLNAYYYDYMANLPSTEGAKFHIANSIWARNDESRLIVPEAFLQTTKSYYGADFFSAPFDDSTVSDINAWVNENTHGMIPQLIQEIRYEEIMYLINALAFEAEWAMPYAEEQIHEGTFTLSDGTTVKNDFMYNELHTYLCDDKATGFIKQYEDGNYSFAAVLPNEDVSVFDYISDMTADSLKKLVDSASHETVNTSLPKFSFDYSTSLKPVLQSMGMKLPFEDGGADFTGLNEYPTTFIADVLHKTYIAVDEKGTKAGAVTAVIMADNAVPAEPKTVYLNRPFIFMILDNQNNLPVFIGYVLDPTQKPE